MKKYLSLVALFALVIGSTNAIGYNSPAGSDPKELNHDREFKQVMKTVFGADSTGLKAAISRGHVLTYVVGEDGSHDGYTVSRIGANTPAGQRVVACIADDSIATGDVGYHKCVTKGFVDFAKWDATAPIAAGTRVCANAEGVLVDCTVLAATANVGIISLEAKAAGTGNNLKVMVNLQ